MEMTEFISDVKREGKVSVDALLMIMAEGIQNGDDPMCIYKSIYKKAYGEHLSEKLCCDWVSKMTHGQHWSYEQTCDVGQRMGINWNVMSKWEWYCAMNAAYSDFLKLAQTYQVEEDADFFAEAAKAFWIDDDDVKGKTIFSYYFNYVA